jgi:hypothetical protein
MLTPSEKVSRDCPCGGPEQGPRNGSQEVRLKELLKRLDRSGNQADQQADRFFSRSALRRSLEVFDLAHPAGQWVPTDENLVHHPSLRSVWSDHSGLRQIGSAYGSPNRHDPGLVQHLQVIDRKRLK